jgi:transaldolase
MPAYRHLVEEATEEVVERVGRHEQMAEEFIDRLFVLFGCEILNVVPGRVSTEVAPKRTPWRRRSWQKGSGNSTAMRAAWRRYALSQVAD